MKKRFKITGKIKYLVVVLVCAVLLGLSYVSDGSPTVLKSIASYTVIPVQQGISGITGFIASKLGNFKSYEKLQKENESLKAKNNDLNLANQKLLQSQKDLERMQALYNLNNYYSDYETIGASVIGRDDGTWFNTFVLDKGSADGIKVDMNVIAHGGLVGIVTDVGTHYCNVRAIIDDSSNVSAQVKTSKDLCIVKGDSTLIKEGRLYFDQMDNNENVVKVGDKIITSDISSKFIPGLTIGTIAEVKVSPNNLTRFGYINPAADFYDIEEVLIITTLKDNGQGENK